MTDKRAIPAMISGSPELMAERIACEEEAMDSLCSAIDGLTRIVDVLVAKLDDNGIEIPSSIGWTTADVQTDIDSYALLTASAREGWNEGWSRR